MQTFAELTTNQQNKVKNLAWAELVTETWEGRLRFLNAAGDPTAFQLQLDTLRTKAQGSLVLYVRAVTQDADIMTKIAARVDAKVTNLTFRKHTDVELTLAPTDD